MSQIGIIIGREFNERVRKKTFIITTILVPLLLVAAMAVPALLMLYTSTVTKAIAVIDESGLIATALAEASDDEAVYIPVDQTLDQARADDSRFGVLWIGSDILDNPSAVRLYANSSTSMMLEKSIETQIAKAVEAEKLRRYDIDDLDRIMADVKTDIVLQTFRNDGDERSMSAGVSFFVGEALAFILYMFLLIYGQAVMQAVIEEKNSRVLDVLVTSVRPFQLMLGKILGVAAVAVVQVSIWGVLLFGAGALMKGAVLPDIAQGAEVQTAQAAGMSGADADMAEALRVFDSFTDMGYMAMIFGYLLLFLVGGYLFYSAMFAAVGASVDNVTDAAQLTTPITIPIILALMIMFVVMKDPDSSLAFWFSVVPFTSPIVMMARIPSGISWWEPLLSLAVLYGSVAAMVWTAAKIYKVGILMHGKKPSFKELYRWIKEY